MRKNLRGGWLSCAGAALATMCFGTIVYAGGSPPCEVPDNGNGTVTLPPAGCGYLSPNDVHLIIAGLPPGTTIEVSAEHTKFFQVDEQPGGPLGGAVESFQSILQMQMTGTGALAGFQRTIFVQAACLAATGPRNGGDAVQTFPNEMLQLQGELFGDPDFDQLSIRAGANFGLAPSTGQTTLTDLGNGTFNVDSFFDIFYEIEFVGAPGSVLDGLSGTTTGESVVMQAGVPAGPAVPTVSEWGLIVMGLLLLTGGTLVIRRRKTEVVAA
jgi:hypothetical protein